MPLAIGALIGGLAGAYIAPVLGFSAATGWAIGSLIGQALAPQPTTTIEAPRLENVQQTTSNILGNPIQIPYGSVRVPGSIIWSDAIYEERVVTKTKSKGGSIGGSKTTKTITYEYYLTFAVAICEGPVTGLGKIWANNKLIRDPLAIPAEMEGLKYTFYPGNETQFPDPLIEAVEGVGKVPAHRGLAYIVFDKFPLAEYGNRAPYNLEFEVFTNPTNGAYLIRKDIVVDSSLGGYGVIDVNLNTKELVWSYAFWGQGGFYSSLGGWGLSVDLNDPYIINKIYDFSPIQKSSFSIGYDFPTTSNMEFHGFLSNGDFVTSTIVSYSGGSSAALIISRNNREVKTSFISESTSRPISNLLLNKYVWGSKLLGIYDKRYIYSISSDLYVSFLEWRYTNTIGAITNYEPKKATGNYNNVSPFNEIESYLYESPAYATIIIGNENNIEDASNLIRFQDVLIYQYNTSSFSSALIGSNLTTLKLEPLFQFNINSLSAHFFNLGLVPNDTSNYSYIPLKIVETETGYWFFGHYFYGLFYIFYDKSEKNLDGYIPLNLNNAYYYNGLLGFVHISEIPGSDEDGLRNHRGYFDKASGVISFVGESNSITAIHQININTKTGKTYLVQEYEDNLVGYANKPTYIYKIDESTFLLIGSFGSSNPSPVWETSLQIVRIRDEGNDVLLSDIVSDISNRSGYTGTDYSVTNISDIPVVGYSIRDRVSARESIEEVINPFFVDVCVSDNIITYKKKDSSQGLELLYSDLGATKTAEEKGNLYTVINPEEISIPKEIDFRYLGYENNYQTSHQRESRNNKATDSKLKTTISSAVIMRDSEAKVSTIKYLREAWINSKEISLVLPKKYLKLEPTDKLIFNTKSGVNIPIKIKEILYSNDVIEVRGVLEDFNDSGISTEYLQSLAASNNNLGKQKILNLSKMFAVPIDSFPLYDIYDNIVEEDEILIYVAANASVDSWPGGDLYVSEDGVDYELVGFVKYPTNVGNIRDGKLITDKLNPFFIDRKSYITAYFRKGLVSSTITLEEVLNANAGLNTFYITGGEYSSLGEIVVAQTIENLGNGIYRLSNLLRGRYTTYLNSLDYQYKQPINLITTGKIVELNNSKLFAGNMPLDNYESLYSYKGVTIGRDFELTDEYDFYYRGNYGNTPPPINLRFLRKNNDLVLNWTSVNNIKTNNIPLANTSMPAVENQIVLTDMNGIVLATALTGEDTFTFTSAQLSAAGLTINDNFRIQVRRKSPVKLYNVTPAEVYYIGSNIYEAMNDVVPNIEIFYNFGLPKNTYIIEDLVGTTNSDLYLQHQTNHLSNIPSSIRKNKRTGVLALNGYRRFQTNGSTAGSTESTWSMAFSIAGHISSNKNISYLHKLINRSGSDSNYFMISYQSNINNIPLQYYIYKSTNYKVYEAAEAPLFKIDTDNFVVITSEVHPTLLNYYLTKFYVNGILIDTQDTGLVSHKSWTGEFRFGDIPSFYNSIYGSTGIDYFAYWDNKTLTQEEVQKLYTLHKGLKI